MLISKMQQPSLRELMEFADELSYLHSEYREITGKSQPLLFYYLQSLIRRGKVMSLTANTGYARRYCIYHGERWLDSTVEPIPSISFEDGVLRLTIYSDNLVLDPQKALFEAECCGGRKLQILKLTNRFFLILDYVLLGVLVARGYRWILRLPWRDYSGTEYMMAFTRLRSIGQNVDVLGVKGKRMIYGR